MSPVEQLYMFEEDLPSLTWAQSQEVEQVPAVPVEHTSSQDSVNLGNSLKRSPPTQSGLADTWYSSSIHPLPQSSLSLPQISDIAMGSSAPEFSIAQQYMTMMDNYDSGACPAQAKEIRMALSKCVDYAEGFISVPSK